MKSIDQLTPEELRVECAEAMGWTHIKCYTAAINGDGDGMTVGYLPDAASRREARDTQSDPEIPNYPTDANAALTLTDALKKQRGFLWRADVESEVDAVSFQFYRGLRGTPGWRKHEATAGGEHAFSTALSMAYLSVIRAEVKP